jgi:hypothetical protein
MQLRLHRRVATDGAKRPAELHIHTNHHSAHSLNLTPLCIGRCNCIRAALRLVTYHATHSLSPRIHSHAAAVTRSAQQAALHRTSRVCFDHGLGANQPASQSSNKHQPHSPSGQPAKNSGKKKVGEFSSRVINQAALQSVSCSVPLCPCGACCRLFAATSANANREGHDGSF